MLLSAGGHLLVAFPTSKKKLIIFAAERGATASRAKRAATFTIYMGVILLYMEAITLLEALVREQWVIPTISVPVPTQ